MLFGAVLVPGVVLGRNLRLRPKHESIESPAVTPLKPASTFMGAAKCGGCHQMEYSRWMVSHHRLAMQPADNSTVLGNFNGARFSNQGVTSFFFRRGGRFMVHTDGRDGVLRDLVAGAEHG
jgi:hypothetical protein